MGMCRGLWTPKDSGMDSSGGRMFLQVSEAVGLVWDWTWVSSLQPSPGWGGDTEIGEALCSAQRRAHKNSRPIEKRL